jgi:hypothetical protein
MQELYAWAQCIGIDASISGGITGAKAQEVVIALSSSMPTIRKYMKEGKQTME